MSSYSTSPVLVLGGTGIVGRRAIKMLRDFHPDLPIAIAARNQDKCRELATEIGNAEAVAVDLDRADLGLGQGAYTAVASILKERALNPLRFAEERSVPYISISDAAFEIAPAVARHIYHRHRVPLMLASHWAAGLTVLPALHFAKEFRVLHKVAITVIQDPAEPLGPMARNDEEQVAKISPPPLVLHEGAWCWAGPDLATRRVVTAAGKELEATAFNVLDTVSLAAATDAQSVRVDFAMTETESYRRGNGPSHEIIIEIEGEGRDGQAGHLRVDIDAPLGIEGLTSLGVALCMERLLGLEGGAAPAPGLYFPDSLVDPAYAIERLRQFGSQISRR